MSAESPVVIGGVAGSGTRVYHTICSQAGYDMGLLTTRNSRDNWPLGRWFYPRWVGPYIAGELDEAGAARMRRELRLWLRLCWPAGPRGRWGWKNPPTLYLLRFFNKLFPGMRYVHVIRDGRDQAFNPKFQYRTYQRVLMSEEEARLDDPARKALHWSRLNTLAEGFAGEHLRGRYLQSRLEALCDDPRGEIGRIFEFLGAQDAAGLERAAAEVRTPGSLGRWKRQPAEQIASIERMIGPTLRHYGYELTPP